ncbi:hypothetical protein [Lihuaxuella thermophila]|uniref:Uncharacterized protein n=1 Tax=Lihuaxuella thermophila TaxID=1173111 RepID=A0A1H8AQY6_9BACL|nr:hypothetical protein [Lihuaxuella thermophila]SEM72219.1 hypothetical protein SAMN05444955_101259 [Lihuaxuella thermophila]
MRPSKKDFADLINQITGEPTMTEQKLDRILHGAKKSYQTNGMDGFFEYMRKIVQAPVSNEWMKKTISQMQTPEGVDQLIKEINLPVELHVEQGLRRKGVSDTPAQAKKRKK